MSELRSRMKEMEEELLKAKEAARLARMDNQQVHVHGYVHTYRIASAVGVKHVCVSVCVPMCRNYNCWQGVV